MTKERMYTYLTWSGCFIAGALVSYALMQFSAESIDSRPALRDTSEDYEFIAPLLLCRDGQNASFEEFDPLKDELEQITHSAEKDGTITSASIYFRDLTKGSWMGIHENDEYSPASLLKVPVLIASLKAAEKDPTLLAKRAYYVREPGQAPPLITDPILTSGHRYSVEELLRGMIIDSDNTATEMLVGGIDGTFLGGIYSELGIKNPYSEEEYKISTRTYALFFRLLYNATFLNREMSEKALSFLSQSKFDKGLRAGVPAEISVAHKYGFKIIEREPSVIELSDCGIVYKPDTPYILCVMARGSQAEIVSTYVRDISSATYAAVADETPAR